MNRNLESKASVWTRLKSSQPFRMIYRTLEETVRIDLFGQSASLAFYAALSLAPLLLLTMSFVSFIDPQLETDLIREITVRLGSRAAEVVAFIIENTKLNPDTRSLSNLTSLVTLLVSSSAVFIQLKTTLILILDKEMPQQKGSSVLLFLKDRVFAIFMVFSFIIASAASLIANLAINYVAPEGSEWFLHNLNRLITFSTFTLIFYALYQLIPRSKRKRSIVVSFAATSSFMFLMGTHLIGRYLTQSAVGSTYGAAGSLVVLLAWVYYSSFIVYILAISLDVYCHLTRSASQVRDPNKSEIKKGLPLKGSVLNETDMV